jgi:D-arabinose 5-phosphate isomerase GutQ/GTP-binding protein EngB required for normal cell division
MDIGTRISKKLHTPFETCQPSGAVLMVNLFDPQIATTKIFLEAIRQNNLPFVIVGNKADLVNPSDILAAETELGEKLLPVSFTSGQNVRDLEGVLKKTFPSGARISVLGIFNTGKTSLIAHFTRKDLKISNMPGTTLEFEEHAWEDRVLIDSIGQLIDINRPLMVGYDFSGLTEPAQMFEHGLRQDAEGILSSINTASSGFLSAVSAILECIQRHGKIVVTGAGASALVAEEIAGQFYETGVTCIPITNSLSQAVPVSFAKGLAEEEGGLARYIAGCVGPQDILIGVSASGGTGFVYEALRLARTKKAITIALTENRDTPLGVQADIIIKSNAKPEGPSSTRIQSAHLAIGHTLVCTIAAMRGLTGEQSIGYMMPEHIATKKMGIK